jgi:Spy/CpxP family protein refolding chaperone
MRNVLPFILSAVIAAACTAQTTPTAPDPNGVDAILKTHAETGILLSMAPLKLTKEERQKIHDILVAGREKVNKDGKAIQDKEAAKLKGMVQAVKDAHAKALKGETPDKEYFDEWDKAMADSVIARANLRTTTVKGNSSKIKEALTKDQNQAIIDEAKKAWSRMYPGQKADPKVYKDDTWYWYYVENVFMSDLTIDLLEQLTK